MLNVKYCIDTKFPFIFYLDMHIIRQFLCWSALDNWQYSSVFERIAYRIGMFSTGHIVSDPCRFNVLWYMSTATGSSFCCVSVYGAVNQI